VRVPVWAYDLARAFWATVGTEEGFPRQLERFTFVLHKDNDGGTSRGCRFE
jgi:hypothetical protein